MNDDDDMDKILAQAPQANHTQENSDETNPLLFWVAYVPMPQADGSEKKNYLSDGKGNLRMYKSEEKMREYLIENTSPEFYKNIVVHSVQGQIVVPLHENELPKFFSSQKGIAPIPVIMPELEIGNLQPLQHLHPDVAPPTALEQLNELTKRKRKRRRP